MGILAGRNAHLEEMGGTQGKVAAGTVAGRVGVAKGRGTDLESSVGSAVVAVGHAEGLEQEAVALSDQSSALLGLVWNHWCRELAFSCSVKEITCSASRL